MEPAQYNDMAQRQPTGENEIIIYHPDKTLTIDVRVMDETVWLNRNQIAQLFGRDVKTIGKHINNALHEELEGVSVVAKFAITASDGKTYQVEHYNLEMITSIGYRVKSKQGIQFRQWANKILKEYLLRGYSINQRLIEMSDRLDRRLLEQDGKIAAIRKDVDFFVRTSLPPKEGIFFDGQIFDAYAFVAGLIRRATKRIVVIDNYIDDTVLVQLSKRKPGVTVDIYDGQISRQLRQDVEQQNAQYPGVALHQYKKAHDRFLIIDETVYHIGASLKDLGKKLFAFSRLEAKTGSELLAQL